MRHFDDTDVFLNQNKVNVCEHTVKMVSHEFLKTATQGVSRLEVGGVEGMEGKLNGNYLRLIPELGAILNFLINSFCPLDTALVLT